MCIYIYIYIYMYTYVYIYIYIYIYVHGMCRIASCNTSNNNVTRVGLVT